MQEVLQKQFQWKKLYGMSINPYEQQVQLQNQYQLE